MSCCARKCWKGITDEMLDRHLRDLSFFRTFGYSVFWAWVRSLYFVELPLKTKNGTIQLGDRIYGTYRVPSIPYHLCRDMFLLLIGIRRRETLHDHIQRPPCATFSLASNHGNAGRPSHNAITPQEKKYVEAFVLSAAEKYALPDPKYAFTRNPEDPRAVINEEVQNFKSFPPSLSKMALHSMYGRFCQDDEDFPFKRILSDTSFRFILKTSEALRHIKFNKASTGNCRICKTLRWTIYNARSEARMNEASEALKVHIRRADLLRTIMNERIKKCQSVYYTHMCKDRNGRLECAMISYDYASNLQLPSTCQETQDDWMANCFGFNVHIFGITTESSKEYNAYLYPETFAHVDSEAVISLLQLYFSQHDKIANAKTLYVYNDSCSGQNRNNFLLAYYVCRILDGHHEVVSWNFLLVGHTKFSPDQLFGLLHHLLKKHDFLIPSDIKTEAERIGRHERIAQEEGEAPWKVNCTVIDEEEDVFKHYKKLAEPFRRFEGIKTKDIAEVKFEATTVNEKRAVKVSYQLVEDTVWHEVAILKRGRQWPEKGILEAARERCDWKPLSKTRKESLIQAIEKIVGCSEEQLRFYQNLPEKADAEASSSIIDRDGNVIHLLPENSPPMEVSLPSSSSPSSTASETPNTCPEEPDLECHSPPAKRARAVTPPRVTEPAKDGSPTLQTPSPPYNKSNECQNRRDCLSRLTPSIEAHESRWMRSVRALEGKRRRKPSNRVKNM